MLFVQIQEKTKKKGRPCLPQPLPPYKEALGSRTYFVQLELTANERKIATEALVSIALRVGVKLLSAETRANKTFLQHTNKIIFSDEDMEVRYSDHRRPFYLVASIN